MTGHCHIRFGVVKRSKRQTALGRLAYQACAKFNDGLQHADYRKHYSNHRGTVVLLPENANPIFADELNFLMAVAFREPRKDSQEGRALDFCLPRAVPDEFMRAVAAFAMVPFTKVGMAVRIDIECPAASDNEPNGHCHGYLAQRCLDSDGFGAKRREWNQLFRRDNGRYVRSLLAGRLTLGCALLGIGAYVDPRRNDQRGLEPPERRIHPKLWRRRDTGVPVATIEDRIERRRERKTKAVEDSKPVLAPAAACGHLIVRSAHQAKHDDADARLARIDSVASEVSFWGSSMELFMDEVPELWFGSGDQPVIFDGEKFRTGHVGANQFEQIIQLARLLDWPALVVEGDNDMADGLILAAVQYGVAVINRHASPEALLQIQTKYGARLLADIRPHDPREIVEASIRPFEQSTQAMRGINVDVGQSQATAIEDNVEFFEMPEPSTQVDEDARRKNAKHAADFFAKQRQDLDDLQRRLPSFPNAQHSAQSATSPVPEDESPGAKP